MPCTACMYNSSFTVAVVVQVLKHSLKIFLVQGQPLYIEHSVLAREYALLFQADLVLLLLREARRIRTPDINSTNIPFLHTFFLL